MEKNYTMEEILKVFYEQVFTKANTGLEQKEEEWKKTCENNRKYRSNKLQETINYWENNKVKGYPEPIRQYVTQRYKDELDASQTYDFYSLATYLQKLNCSGIYYASPIGKIIDLENKKVVTNEEIMNNPGQSLIISAVTGEKYRFTVWEQGKMMSSLFEMGNPTKIGESIVVKNNVTTGKVEFGGFSTDNMGKPEIYSGSADIKYSELSNQQFEQELFNFINSINDYQMEKTNQGTVKSNFVYDFKEKLKQKYNLRNDYFNFIKNPLEKYNNDLSNEYAAIFLNAMYSSSIPVIKDQDIHNPKYLFGPSEEFSIPTYFKNCLGLLDIQNYTLTPEELEMVTNFQQKEINKRLNEQIEENLDIPLEKEPDIITETKIKNNDTELPPIDMNYNDELPYSFTAEPEVEHPNTMEQTKSELETEITPSEIENKVEEKVQDTVISKKQDKPFLEGVSAKSSEQIIREGQGLEMLRNAGIPLSPEQEQIIFISGKLQSEEFKEYQAKRQERLQRQQELRDKIQKENEAKENWQNNPEHPNNLSQNRLEAWKKELVALEQVYAINPSLLTEEQIKYFSEIKETIEMYEKEQNRNHEIDTGMSEESQNWYQEHYTGMRR